MRRFHVTSDSEKDDAIIVRIHGTAAQQFRDRQQEFLTMQVIICSWWRHPMEAFSALLAICEGNLPVHSPHKGQWRGGLMFSLISAWINGWGNNREAGDLRRHRVHHDVIVMWGLVSLGGPLRQMVAVNTAVWYSVHYIESRLQWDVPLFYVWWYILCFIS